MFPFVDNFVINPYAYTCIKNHVKAKTFQIKYSTLQKFTQIFSVFFILTEKNPRHNFI